MFKNKEHGFTLAEIMLVVLVIGVLASLAIPKVGAVIEKNISMEGVNILTALTSSQKRYELETEAYAAALTDLDVTIPASVNFGAPALVAVGNPDVQIARNGGLYTLTADVDGTGAISCSSLSDICTKMGY